MANCFAGTALAFVACFFHCFETYLVFHNRIFQSIGVLLILYFQFVLSSTLIFQVLRLVFVFIYLFILLLNQGTSREPDQKVTILAAASLNLADFASVAGDKEDGIEIAIPLEASIGSFKSCVSLCVRETRTYLLLALLYSCNHVNILFNQYLS